MTHRKIRFTSFDK